jgi:hypothetical protein
LCKLFSVPYALHLGFHENGIDSLGNREAHAWLVSGRIFVTGGRAFRDHRAIACYMSTEAAALP